MFKPSPRLRSRSSRHARVDHVAGFAETQFAHHEDDEDYSGFAPTEMFEQDPLPPLRLPSEALREAAAMATARVAVTAGDDAARSWATSRWVEAQEA
ncbi:MAG TPA: hypothetical protein VF453_00245, partial [Burkholderiaceae bacterium]